MSNNYMIGTMIDDISEIKDTKNGDIFFDTSINASDIISGKSCFEPTTTIEIDKDAILGINFKDEIFDMIMSRLSAKPIVQHKCHNCGANVELDEDRHIFICPYCDSTYLVGTNQIYG